LSKAYDVINQYICSDELNSYGTRGQLKLWFKSYLSNLSLPVEIRDTDVSNSFKNSYISSCLTVEHSVSQESGLELLLFLLHTNDLTENVQGIIKLVLFADDTNLFITG
jgi:hypothetical protein